MILIIDGRKVEGKKGQMILDAASSNGIYIPHLCAHPELSSYGGCRLCIVEVDGMKGYPTACTTEIREGMNIRTATKEIEAMRKEIIQLMLSDHPVGCLLCEDEEECGKSQITIRKAGATTGCRWCPNDRDCELQDIVEHYGIREMIFPVVYQGYEVEKLDPFFDRDYNLCIYCGRCVRICREHRLSNVIGLNQRGKNVTIGPAYNISHVEAGCEFCGACISICPTGANFERSRKWAGKPEDYRSAFCGLCGMNCDLQVARKGDRMIGTIPPGDPHLSGGELCVKGRFCLSELVNSPLRLREPSYRFPEGAGMIGWPEAFDRAAEIIRETDRGKSAVMVSPSLSLEELKGVERFAREVLNTGRIASSMVHSRFPLFLRMLLESCSLDEVEKSDAIFSFYLNGNYNYGPLTLAIKRSAEAGIPYCQVGCFEDTTSRFARERIEPNPGREEDFFKKVLQYLEKGSGGNTRTRALARRLQSASDPCLVVGHSFLDMSRGVPLLQVIRRIAERTRSRVFVASPASNLPGLAGVSGLTGWDRLEEECREGAVDLLYVFGDHPFPKRPPVRKLIYQGAFPPPASWETDLVLPASVAGETPGSVMTREGDIKKISRIFASPEGVKPTLEILSRVASKTARKKWSASLSHFRQSIQGKESVLKRLGAFPSRKRFPRVPKPDARYPFYLLIEKSPHHFQNISLNRVSEGMRCIYPVNTLLIHPTDARKMGLGEETKARIGTRKGQIVVPVLIRNMIRPGFLLIISPVSDIYPTNPCPVHLGRN